MKEIDRSGRAVDSLATDGIDGLEIAIELPGIKPIELKVFSMM